MELCSCPGKDEGLIRFLALGIKTLTGLVLIVLPSQHAIRERVTACHLHQQQQAGL